MIWNFHGGDKKGKSFHWTLECYGFKILKHNLVLGFLIKVLSNSNFVLLLSRLRICSVNNFFEDIKLIIITSRVVGSR